MTRLTPAEHRALQRISRDDGKLVVVAFDQRASLRKMLVDAKRPDDDRSLYQVKVDLARTLAGEASAVLGDPEIALPAMVTDETIPPRTGLIVAVEQTDPPWVNGLRRSALVPEFGAVGVRSVGGDAGKLLVYLRPDSAASVGHAESVVRPFIEDCSASDLLAVIETVVYPLDGEDPDGFGRDLEHLVPEAASLGASWGAKFLKLQYPGSTSACKAITDVARVPWAVLSGGASFAVFRTRLQSALEAGASGFIAGRALWQESVRLGPADRRRWLAGTGADRLRELASILETAGRPWAEMLTV